MCVCARVCVFRPVLSYLLENYRDHTGVVATNITPSTSFQGHDIMATDH